MWLIYFNSKYLEIELGETCWKCQYLLLWMRFKNEWKTSKKGFKYWLDKPLYNAAHESVLTVELADTLIVSIRRVLIVVLAQAAALAGPQALLLQIFLGHFTGEPRTFIHIIPRLVIHKCPTRRRSIIQSVEGSNLLIWLLLLIFVSLWLLLRNLHEYIDSKIRWWMRRLLCDCSSFYDPY